LPVPVVYYTYLFNHNQILPYHLILATENKEFNSNYIAFI
jgi:hypothetical protein